MAIFKCKMCGGSLDVEENAKTVVCDYCGNQQTLPSLNDEKITGLYNRANQFRQNNEYDKAMELYEKILEENGSDAESYWSIILCKYGIQYVEDPTTHKRMPTVNRAQFTSIFDDTYYQSALQYADTSQRLIYEKEATAINEIQKGILAISQNEEPFDIFICYKETNELGQRTYDSVYANDLYHALTGEGFKVFFAPITLEDKLGSAYEPYIFAALNSAKVMIVLGTKAEYFNAVWVKNEWSRYLALIKGGAKKTLIPAYKDMDPYSLPKEFAHLQAQDMSKLGFMPDLIRGIKKIIGFENSKKATATSSEKSSSNNSNIDNLLKRVKIFLESQDWAAADAKCEAILDIDPENATAYIYKLLAQTHLPKEERLEFYVKNLELFPSYKNILRYADKDTCDRFLNYNRKIKERLEIERQRQEAETQELYRKNQIQEAKARELSSLISARDNTSHLILSQTKEKERIEKQLQNNASLSKSLNLTKVLAIINLIMSIICAFTAISYAATDGDLGELFPIFGVTLIVLFFLAIRTEGKPIRRCFFCFITLGITNIFFSIKVIKIVFHSAKKKKVLLLQLQAIERELQNSRNSLNSINQSITLCQSK